MRALVPAHVLNFVKYAKWAASDIRVPQQYDITEVVDPAMAAYGV